MTKRLRILVTGSNGYVGSHVKSHFTQLGWDAHGLDIGESKRGDFHAADIGDLPSTRDAVAAVRPDVVVHAAGLSSLAKCESDRPLADRVNVQGTRNILAAMRDACPQAKLVFLSSDYVFDGTRGGYREDDPRQPRTYYGLTKKVSEDDIAAAWPNHVVCRTANVFGHGGNFFNFITERMASRQPADVFDDVFYTPTYIAYLVDSIAALVRMDYRGTVHIAGAERTSRHQFAVAAAAACGAPPGLFRPVPQPPGGLISPDSSLDTSLSRSLLGNYRPDLRRALLCAFGRLVYPYFHHRDSRGFLLGIFQGRAFREANYVESAAGCVRGGHYHRGTDEAFYIVDGEIDISLSDVGGGEPVSFRAGKGDIIMIRPGTVHTFTVLSDAKWINMLSEPMDANAPDIHRP